MAFRVAISAFLTLFVVMGIGRFAFTPQVPLMIQAHQLTLTSASLVAALNYLGYLCGSVDAMRARHKVALRLQLGTWGAVVLTALSAFADGPWWHGIIRFAIGWASGCALVLAAAWSNEQLHQYGRPGAVGSRLCRTRCRHFYQRSARGELAQLSGLSGAGLVGLCCAGGAIGGAH